MNPIAQAALDRARHPTPAPVFSTETASRPNPVPVLVVTGPINHFMRLQARAEATATVLGMHRTLAAPNGVALVVEHLKRHRQRQARRDHGRPRPLHRRHPRQ